MIEYIVKKDGKVVAEGKTLLLMAGAVVDENDEGYKGSTLLAQVDDKIRIISILHSLAKLNATVIKNSDADKETVNAMYDYVMEKTLKILNEEDSTDEA